MKLLNVSSVKHDGKGFRLILLAHHITSYAEVKNWVVSFSDCTGTDWNVRYTRPQLGRYYFICRFSSFGKKAGRHEHHASADRNCSARLNIRITTAEQGTIATVTVDHEHSHGETAENLGMRKVAPEVCHVL